MHAFPLSLSQWILIYLSAINFDKILWSRTSWKGETLRIIFLKNVNQGLPSKWRYKFIPMNYSVLTHSSLLTPDSVIWSFITSVIFWWSPATNEGFVTLIHIYGRYRHVSGHSLLIQQSTVNICESDISVELLVKEKFFPAKEALHLYFIEHLHA